MSSIKHYCCWSPSKWKYFLLTTATTWTWYTQRLSPHGREKTRKIESCFKFSPLFMNVWVMKFFWYEATGCQLVWWFLARQELSHVPSCSYLILSPLRISMTPGPLIQCYFIIFTVPFCTMKLQQPVALRLNFIFQLSYLLLSFNWLFCFELSTSWT